MFCWTAMKHIVALAPVIRRHLYDIYTMFDQRAYWLETRQRRGPWYSG